ncbi:Ornithine aminotransferase [Pseudomonas sp. R2-37-08W]|uniref:aspartate aminotransferase family protein n=1 Tax=Pseudomonas sp. R2-37-08W TaxID=1173273 RepID=UPI000F560FF3|nr:aminotransferase class III-fold pyridoxal phosphate-dependent enzyme [Pseudomonas sp. R2-37-08W]AZF10847.1 Ornithine aminotransferase [Pseudomonas sp. R2-37-08W]
MNPLVVEPAIDAAQVDQYLRKHVNSGYARLASLMNLPIEQSSRGVYIYDDQGRQYLDAGGYGVFFLGHGHPVIVEAVARQLQKNALASKLLLNPQQAFAAHALAAHCPGNLEYVFFCNSGAEATEAGLKLARLNGCRRTLSTLGGFHGKTLGALAVTGRESYREPFSGLLSDSDFVPFGDSVALELQLRASSQKACVILEPIQAEAGVVLPPPGYLRRVRELCNQYGAVLIIDEIQSGLGRTGYWWGCDHEQVVPDIMLVGKSLSGGCVPVSAMVASATIYAPFNRNPTVHTSTFGANPLAMAAVQATLQVMVQEDLVARARLLGQDLHARFSALLQQRGWAERVELRSAGLLFGFEFADASIAANMVMALIEQRIIVCHSLNDHRVLRLTPSPLLSTEDCNWLLEGFAQALTTSMPSL